MLRAKSAEHLIDIVLGERHVVIDQLQRLAASPPEYGGRDVVEAVEVRHDRLPYHFLHIGDGNAPLDLFTRVSKKKSRSVSRNAAI